MLVVVAYDVRDDKRRSKVASELLNFGTRVQFSVFECHLDEERLVVLRKRLTLLFDEERDRVHYFLLCARDQAAVACDGLGNEPRDWDFYLY